MQLDSTVFFRGVFSAVLFILVSSAILMSAGPGPTLEVQAKLQPDQSRLDLPADLPCRVSRRFPDEVRQWCGWITHFSEQHDLSPDLIAGLVWYESGGKARAYSRSGAVGLMQVMPRDGLAAEFMCANGPCFASRPTRAELEDPQYNLEYGTRMLAGLWKRHQDLRQALKSYGPAGVGYSYADKILAIYERYRADP